MVPRLIVICRIQWWCSLFSVLDPKHPSLANLVQKIKTVSLRWNLVPRLTRICRIQWRCSLFPVLNRRHPFLLSLQPLQEALNKLVNSKKLKVKLHNGKNSYYIENDSFHEDKNKHQLKMLKICSHLIMELPYRKITLKRQKEEPF